VLRNAKDDEPVASPGTTVADLRGDASRKPGVELVDDGIFTEVAKAPPASTTAPANTRTVRIIRATKEEAMEVEIPPAHAPAAAPTAGWITNSDQRDAAATDAALRVTTYRTEWNRNTGSTVRPTLRGLP
jgi:hypothetical protein